MDNRDIGIFDSGIGGATVLKEILKILPKENYIYYSDSKNNPYGDKDKEEIIKICDKNVKLLLEKNCKIIIIACNTASAIAAEYLRKKYIETPIIAIEPAYKMVFDYAYDDPTLVMATRGTIESEKFNLLYNKYNNHKTILLPCVGLAELIEIGNDKEIKEYLNNNLLKYKGNVKNIVLGCTHYPIIKSEIKEVLGDVEFFNGAANLAIHLKKTMEKNGSTNNNGTSKIEFIDTSTSLYKEKRFYSFLNQ